MTPWTAIVAAHSVIVGNRRALYKGAREQEGLPKHGVSMRSEKNKNGSVALLDKNGAVGALPDKNQNYRPSDKEPFMNERQRAYFRDKLLMWKDEILKEAKETLQHLQDENQNHPDLADRASSETDRAIELRARDRQRKLIAKIDAALQRLEDGTYGYCEETGEPISLRRLDARPIATLSIEAQERHERRERVYRDD
jgi:DnaK suppressor protein